jgi:hypothetical protein
MYVFEIFSAGCPTYPDIDLATSVVSYSIHHHSLTLKATQYADAANLLDVYLISSDLASVSERALTNGERIDLLSIQPFLPFLS